MRRLFAYFSAVCLALAIMLAVMWVVSYSYFDAWGFAYSKNRPTLYVESAHGHVQISSVQKMPDPKFHWQFSILHQRFNPKIQYWGLIYFGQPQFGPLRMPYWMIVAMLALPASIYIIFLRRPHKPGTCKGCGYDLRASPERCPECGSLVPAAKSIS